MTGEMFNKMVDISNKSTIGPVSVSRNMARLRAIGADWGLDIKNNIRWMTVVTSD